MGRVGSARIELCYDDCHVFPGCGDLTWLGIVRRLTLRERSSSSSSWRTRRRLSVFEIARVLESFGELLQEANRAFDLEAPEIYVKVRAFEEGSFVVDFLISNQQYLLPALVPSHPMLLRMSKVCWSI